MIIAIDGTLASGKGTIARRLSDLFALPHMDTGRLYRATGVAAMNAGADLTDAKAIAEIASKLEPSLFSEAELAELNQIANEEGVTSSPIFILYKDGKQIKKGYAFPDEHGEGIEDFIAPIL